MQKLELQPGIPDCAHVLRVQLDSKNTQPFIIIILATKQLLKWKLG